ncbi:MAG: alpha/beta hydrolase [Anaeromyxobacter sp.]|nr:alpha/beta hydrolase [Anaeromyxobacter sp.]MBL0276420.1 alpha/beta hydrolase [Anaeromyxobacter sp.]
MTIRNGTTLTRAALPLLALAALASCTPRYSTRPPLDFADLPYAGPDGKAWPVATRQLPETARAFGMARPPTVAYVELNRGGPKGTVVFLHGLGSYLKFWWFQLEAFAADGWHVVALDLPGFGKSDKPASFPYTMEAMGEAARELTTALGATRVVLVGHSMGGQTALSWAIRHPAEVRALVLTAPAGFEAFTPREQAWFTSVMSTTLVKKTPEYGVWGTVAQANFQRWRPELAWLVEERVRLTTSPGFDAYAYAQVRSVQALARNDFVRQSLGQVQAPTLVVFGEEDRLIPNPFLHGGRTRDLMAAGAAAIPGAALAGLPGCGHSVQLDCPAEYAAAVGPFLAALPAP